MPSCCRPLSDAVPCPAPPEPQDCGKQRFCSPPASRAGCIWNPRKRSRQRECLKSQEAAPSALCCIQANVSHLRICEFVANQYNILFSFCQARSGQTVNARGPMPPSVKKPVIQFALSAADHSAACFACAICFAASSDTAPVPPNTVTLPAFLAFMNCFCAWFRLSDTSSTGALFSAA